MRKLFGSLVCAAIVGVTVAVVEYFFPPRIFATYVEAGCNAAFGAFAAAMLLPWLKK